MIAFVLLRVFLILLLVAANAFFAAAGRNVPGVNAGVALSLELPVSNTAREADRDFKRAQHEQASIASRDLERQMPVAVLGALDDLRLSLVEHAQTIECLVEREQQVGATFRRELDGLHGHAAQ